MKNVSNITKLIHFSFYKNGKKFPDKTKKFISKNSKYIKKICIEKNDKKNILNMHIIFISKCNDYIAYLIIFMKIIKKYDFSIFY